MGAKLRVYFIIGPTASGKTDYGIRLAEAVGGEVVSIDSRYFYRGMDIGTAKPTMEERRGIPHYLIDVAEPDEVWSLGRFIQEADRAFRDIASRGKVPIAVGGTGQYVRALLDGWEVPEGEPDLALRTAVEHWGDAIGGYELWQALRLLDRPCADEIDWRNRRRTVRALQHILQYGVPFSANRGARECAYDARVLGMKRDRGELYARIDARVDAMFAAGLVDEVRSLLDRGLSPELPSMSAIGYGEVCAYLRGESSLEEAIERTKFRTHGFVRRQGSWFHASDPRIQWVDPDGDLVL